MWSDLLINFTILLIYGNVTWMAMANFINLCYVYCFASNGNFWSISMTRGKDGCLELKRIIRMASRVMLLLEFT